MLQQLIKKITRVEQALILLSVVSLSVVIWQHFGMTKTYSLSPELLAPAKNWNDDINDGVSRGHLNLVDNTFVLDCNLKKSANTFAFCGFIQPLIDHKQGVDLSGYDTLNIDIALESDAEDTVIIYLLNLDDNAITTEMRRANSATIYPSSNMQTYSLKLTSFSLPSWWLFKFPELKTHVREADISNVTDIQISSGDNTVERQETIKVKNITFKGKWIRKEPLYLSVLIVWLAFFFTYLTYRLVTLNKRLHLSKTKTRELAKLNNFLAIEKDKFESMAKIDPLTHTFNRAGIRDIFDEAIKNLQAKNQPCALIMFDIDHFKQVNDTYGHAVGDEVLVALANYIKANTRSKDYLMRWGGEEFILVCTNTQLEIASLIADKLRKGIEQQTLAQRNITCSFGVGTLNQDIAKTFEATDKALYKAKNSGRNRVIISQ